MIVQCKTCGKNTNKKIFYIKKFGDRLYCSKPCYYQSISKPKIKRICEQCQTEFEVHASQIKYHGARFCSKACKDLFNHGDNSYRWIEKPHFKCKQCGKDFILDNWRTKDSYRGQFCTRDCRYKWFVGENSSQWQGGITPINMKIRRSKEMQIWRKAVLERDNYTCVLCGSQDKLEIDHIKRFSDYPELRFAIDNGRVLCKKCHTKTPTFGAKRRNSKGQFSK